MAYLDVSKAMHQLVNIAERAIEDGQPGAPWAAFSVEVTGSFLRLVSELEQIQRTGAE